MLANLKNLMGNTNYMLLIGSCSVVLSQNMTIMTAINLVLTPYNYTQREGGIFGFTSCMMCIPGMIVSSLILYGKREKFNSFTLLNIFVSFISLIAFHASIIFYDTDTGFKLGIGSILVNGLSI